MKKTKIICTMGPNTNDIKIMKGLIEAGMDIARFNFSHGDHEEHLGRLTLLKKLRSEMGLPVAALLDTKGPEIRTGLLEGGKKITLKDGQKFTLTVKEQMGSSKIVYINYSGLVKDVKKGDKILIDDGLIELKVEKVGKSTIDCVVINGGELGEKKGVNVPGVAIKLPSLTKKDKEDIKFGIEQDFDFIAASFVRDAKCIKEIKKMLKDAGSHMMVIAKIENKEGIENIDSIIDAADGIMVARGDMGVEIPEEEVPFIQKQIIGKCNLACKPVITATQMLDSMIRNPRPTRAEVTDVANAIYDGTDAVMLSGETANGKYPIQALKMMAKIAKETEQHLDHEAYRARRALELKEKNVSNEVGYCAVETADNLNAKVIIAPSISGFTTRMLSKWRPTAPIIGLSPNNKTLRQMKLYWGVTPIDARRALSTTELIYSSIDKVKEKKIVKKGDLVIVTAGVINNKDKDRPAQDTNAMQIERVN